MRPSIYGGAVLSVDQSGIRADRAAVPLKVTAMATHPAAGARTSLGSRREKEAAKIRAVRRRGERRSRHVFRREGEYWSVHYEGTVRRFRDCKGMRYLALLLANPGVAIAAIELSYCVDHAAELGAVDATGDIGDISPATLLQNRENARVRVTRGIATVLRRIREHHPALGAHLRATVRTGVSCIYHPDPRAPIEWKV